MSGRLPYAPAFDHMVYVRVFEGCNLHCEHCFIPKNPKRMTLDDIARVPEHVRGFTPAGSRILLQWHGGEPTMFGSAWMEEAIGRIAEAGGDMLWKHGIQTNLMTYDDAWADVYRRHFDGEVGVSWDPVIRLLRRDRPESHAEFDGRFWANMERLLADGLDPYLVVTFTGTLVNRFRNPTDFFDFLVDRGIRRVHLERVTETGYARDNWDRVGLDNAGYSRAMARWLRAYVQWRRQFDEEAPPLVVSPLDGLLDSSAALARGEAQGYGCWSGSCDTTFHTIDASGYKRGCTALTSEFDNPRWQKAALRFMDPVAAREERRFNCGTCDFRRICSSGCLALGIEDGSGECSGGYHLFETARDIVRRFDLAAE